MHILTYTHTHTHTHSQGLGTENVPWRITTVNQDFSLCETYHTVLGVPRVASDDDLKAVGQFRSKGRIPVSLIDRWERVWSKLREAHVLLWLHAQCEDSKLKILLHTFINTHAHTPHRSSLGSTQSHTPP